MNESTAKQTLHQKLMILQKECNYLQKENKGFQFSYVSSSQTLGSVRSKMDELGVLLIPGVIGHNVIEFNNQKGNHEFFTELEMKFTWVDADNPNDLIECPFYGQGVDNAEKGVGKALTYAEKYFLLKFFHIATDKDDPDSFQNKQKGELVPAENAPEFRTPETPPPPLLHNQPKRNLRAETGKMLVEMCDGDVGEASFRLKEYSGKTKLEELTEAQLHTVYGKVKKDFEKPPETNDTEEDGKKPEQSDISF